ncbi:MAG: DUF305 domain-containing protein [Planctomycetia bacterium]|nr:MAG: DUF305 domain-containing protein [Planctomycetia bacterium]
MAALVPLGCQSDRSNEMGRDDSAHSTKMKMPAAKSDGEFAGMMAMHHEGAIEMGRYEAQNGSRADVRALATKMADAQSTEKPKLESIARDAGNGRMQPDPMMQEHSMKDMEAPRAARGAEVDRVFLNHMIDHHQSGVEMARAAMPNLRRDELRRMATKMIDDQSKEISQMRAMLNQ